MLRQDRSTCRFVRLLSGFGLLLTLAATTVCADTRYADVFPEEAVQRYRVQRLLLERAQQYLDTACSSGAPCIEARTTLVRGLLQAGIAPRHPFIQKQVAFLAALNPENERQSLRLRELGRLLRLSAALSNGGATWTHLAFMEEEGRRLRCELSAHHDTYRTWGVVRLAKPRHAIPGRTPDPAPVPSVPDALLAVCGTAPVVLRKVDFVSEIGSFPGRIGDASLLASALSSSRFETVPRGYVRILLADRLRI